MEGLNVDQALFYGFVWTMGFLSSLFVTINSSDFKSISKCFVIGAVSGFLSFSIVSVFVGRTSEPVVGHWYYLGLSSLIGLSSKYQNRIIQLAVKKFTGFDIQDETKDKCEP